MRKSRLQIQSIFDILSEDGSGERVQSIFRRCGEVEVLVYSLS